ncbi:Na+/H+ antiporter subunit E [Novosphingobium decolorationis]|uniref:Na+/H+ antiporter subunit E n=1 Tax=Novosphingobium decolorationis TaxID=2698673 RepID=A0ABX8E6B1_9SPHN|nr:Na+/H+ antiporter subunit E [Novosphingobium decolorationis]QVM84554.1 Na+/H+ antiporter subunit E [Novosphingobium decolorationis]
MIHRLLPHPGLTAMLLVMWMIVFNSLNLGVAILGLVFAVLVPLFSAPFWPERAKLRMGLPLVGYLFLVLYDIVVANFQVARLILFKRNKDLRPAWLSIPLELQSAEAITVLAGTISLTPGTVSVDISTDARHLLVHALHTDDPDGEIAQIKQRYERRLMEIFA